MVVDSPHSSHPVLRKEAPQESRLVSSITEAAKGHATHNPGPGRPSLPGNSVSGE